MPAPQEEPDQYWSEIDTPDPNQFLVGVYVNRGYIRGNMSTFPVGTLLSKTPSFIAPEAACLQKYGAYSFVRRKPHNAKYVVYIFGLQPVPTYPALGAVPFKTEYDCKPLTWEAILEGIQFVSDYTTLVPISTANGVISYQPRLRVQYAYRPSVTIDTIIRMDYFMSNAPFDLSGVTYDNPQPTDVSWDIRPLGDNGTFPRCLHDIERIPAVSPTLGLLSGQVSRIFPATNTLSWIDYPMGFDLIQRDPNYVGVLRTAIAPPLLEIVKIVR